MKYITHILLLLIIAPTSLLGLNPGDIMFVAWNGDADDGLAIVTLVDIPANTTLYFNDNEWNGSPAGGGGAFNNLTEFEMTWNTGAAIIPAGTIVDFTDIDNTGNPGFGASIGTLTDNLQVNASNEVVYIFEGTNNATPTTFITAMANDGFSAANGTLAGTGLTAGINALAITGDEDLMEYRGILCADANTLRDSLADPTYWITEDGSGDQSSNGAPDFPHSVGAFTIGCNTYYATAPYCGDIFISDTTSSSFIAGFASLWLRADSGTSSTIDGNSISFWNDESLNGNNVNQASIGLRPTYQNDLINNFNFNPVIQFDGTDDELIRNNNLLQNNSSNASFFAVYKSSNSFGTLLADAFTINGPDRGINFSVGVNDNVTFTGLDGNSFGVMNGDNIGNQNPYISPNTNNLFPSNNLHLSSFIKSSSTGNIQRNGNTLPTIGTLDATTETGYSSNFYIGSGRGTDRLYTPYFQGTIAEIIVFDSLLTIIQQQQIQTYLAIKYGITLGHDYLSLDTNVIYDVSNGYANGIFGIGRNNGFAFYQPKSKSETDYSGVTIEATMSIGDENYLITGHDNGSLARITVGGQNNTLTRKWYAEMTGGVGTVSIELDLVTIGANTGAATANVKIGISNSPALTNIRWMEAISVASGVATFTGVDLYDKYYTFSAAP